MNRYGKTTTCRVNTISSVNRETYMEASKIISSENRFDSSCSDQIPRNDNAPMIQFLEDRPEGSSRVIEQIGHRYIFADLVRQLLQPDDCCSP